MSFSVSLFEDGTINNAVLSKDLLGYDGNSDLLSLPLVTEAYVHGGVGHLGLEAVLQGCKPSYQSWISIEETL